MTNYPRHEYVASSEYDHTFRVLSGVMDFVDDYQGSVDGPEGHLTMLSIDTSNVDSVPATVPDYPVPAQGLYIVHESSLGIIVVFAYRSEEDRTADWEMLAHAISLGD